MKRTLGENILAALKSGIRDLKSGKPLRATRVELVSRVPGAEECVVTQGAFTVQDGFKPGDDK